MKNWCLLILLWIGFVFSADVDVFPNTFAAIISTLQENDVAILHPGSYNVSSYIVLRTAISIKSAVRGSATFVCNVPGRNPETGFDVRANVNFTNVAFTGCGAAVYLLGGNTTIDSCDFYSNHQAIYSSSGGIATVIDSSFTNHSDTVMSFSANGNSLTRVNVSYNVCVIRASDASMTITDSIFIGNECMYGLLQIYGSESARYTLKNTVFHSFVGTALHISAYNFEVYNSSFTNSTGSAILAYNCNSVSVTSTTFKSVETGISVRQSNFSIAQSSFVSVKRGVDLSDGVKANITNCSFTGGSYGAIKIDASTATIYSSSFSNNTNFPYGGAFNAIDSALEIYQSSFIGNNPTSFWGGAGYADNTTLVGQDLVFFQNGRLSGISGGALYLSQGSASLTNVTMDQNGPPQALPDGSMGGAIYVEKGCKLTITRSLFSASYGHTGGAVYLSADVAASITNTKFLANQATIGGAMYAISSASLYILDSIIERNVAIQDGGGIYCSDTAVKVVDSTIRQNQADNGGGIYLDNGGSLDVGGCDIEYNTATLNGGGIYISSGPRVYIATSNMYNSNNAESGSGVYAGTAEGVFSTLIMRQVKLTTSGSVNFCCGGSKKNSPVNETCSYPACSASSCRETTNSCECPFVYRAPFATDIPNPKYVNTTCTCGAGWSGSKQYCQTLVSLCLTDLNKCDRLTNCSAAEYSTNYTCSACPPGYTGSGKTGCMRITTSTASTTTTTTSTISTSTASNAATTTPAASSTSTATTASTTPKVSTSTASTVSTTPTTGSGTASSTSNAPATTSTSSKTSTISTSAATATTKTSTNPTNPSTTSTDHQVSSASAMHYFTLVGLLSVAIC